MILIKVTMIMIMIMVMILEMSVFGDNDSRFESISCILSCQNMHCAYYITLFVSLEWRHFSVMEDSTHKGPVTRKTSQCHDVILNIKRTQWDSSVGHIAFGNLARQDGRHFADDIFKCIFLNENASILIQISLKFIPKSPIENIPVLVQIMAWRRLGDKP